MIIDLQRRLAEIGRIRIGQQVPTGNGKTRPEKLATFRLTTPDRARIERAAGLFGGRPAQWQAPAGKQWELITATDVLDVIVPPSDMAFSQHYELWSAGGCQRRCDGRSESISDGPCVCDPAARDCDIHTRLSVMIRDLPGLGVWRIDTSGYYAAVELQGAVEVIRIAAGRGQMLPARLRLEQRQVKRPDQPVRRFAVPVLDIEVSPGQLIGGGNGHQALPAAAGPAAVDGAVPLTPVPAGLPAAPVPAVAEQAAAVAQPQERPRRRNAAQPLPATGIQPRTAAQAQAAPSAEEAAAALTRFTADLASHVDHDLAQVGRCVYCNTCGQRLYQGKLWTPKERDELRALAAGDPGPEPPPPDPTEPGSVTAAQLRKLGVLFTGLGFTRAEREQRLIAASEIVKREISSAQDLSLAEASGLIDVLEGVEGDRDRLIELLVSLDQQARAGEGQDAPAGDGGEE